MFKEPGSAREIVDSAGGPAILVDDMVISVFGGFFGDGSDVPAGSFSQSDVVKTLVKALRVSADAIVPSNPKISE